MGMKQKLGIAAAIMEEPEIVILDEPFNALDEKSATIVGNEIFGGGPNSILFKKTFIGNNCVIKNSIILNDVYIGDNAVIENCIVESHSTINPGEKLGDENEIKIINERNFRYLYLCTRKGNI